MSGSPRSSRIRSGLDGRAGHADGLFAVFAFGDFEVGGFKEDVQHLPDFRFVIDDEDGIFLLLA